MDGECKRLCGGWGPVQQRKREQGVKLGEGGLGKTGAQGKACPYLQGRSTVGGGLIAVEVWGWGSSFQEQGAVPQARRGVGVREKAGRRGL